MCPPGASGVTGAGCECVSEHVAPRQGRPQVILTGGESNVKQTSISSPHLTQLLKCLRTVLHQNVTTFSSLSLTTHTSVSLIHPHHIFSCVYIGAVVMCETSFNAQVLCFSLFLSLLYLSFSFLFFLSFIQSLFLALRQNPSESLFHSHVYFLSITAFFPSLHLALSMHLLFSPFSLIEERNSVLAGVMLRHDC